jgi:hypothetical protein
MTYGKIEVSGFDNRGDNEFPFGFVYFTDGSRVGFAVTALTPDRCLLWNEQGGYWTKSGLQHLNAARAHLTDHKVIPAI